jgi:uncharacterized membrane protein YsdA (DUF1294 family)
MKYTVYVLVIINIVAFILMAIDKHKAKTGRWRIKESTLLLIAFFMGGSGCYLGSLICRHKTKKKKFKILLPISMIFNFITMISFWFFTK